MRDPGKEKEGVFSFCLLDTVKGSKVCATRLGTNGVLRCQTGIHKRLKSRV